MWLVFCPHMLARLCIGSSIPLCLFIDGVRLVGSLQNSTILGAWAMNANGFIRHPHKLLKKSHQFAVGRLQLEVMRVALRLRFESTAATPFSPLMQKHLPCHQ